MWEWSHTENAYAYANEQLHELPMETLLEIMKAWQNKLKFPHKEIIMINNKHIFADKIWEFASSYDHGRNCSNGGHELYLDPEGYYTVDLNNMPEDWTPTEY